MQAPKGKPAKGRARPALRVTDALEQMESRRRKAPVAPGKSRNDLDLDSIR